MNHPERAPASLLQAFSELTLELQQLAQNRDCLLYTSDAADE